MADEAEDLPLADGPSESADDLAPGPVPFMAKVWIWVIAGIALGGIALMCLTVFIIIATRK